MVPIRRASLLNFGPRAFHALRVKEVNRVFGIEGRQLALLAAAEAIEFRGMQPRGEQEATLDRIGGDSSPNRRRADRCTPACPRHPEPDLRFLQADCSLVLQLGIRFFVSIWAVAVEVPQDNDEHVGVGDLTGIKLPYGRGPVPENPPCGRT